MITLQTYIPKSLNHFIKSFWFLQVEATAGIYEEEIIPDGHHEIIFHLNNGTAKRKSENSNWLKEPEALIASQNLKSYMLQLQSGSKLFGIRFYPHTLYHLLRVPISHFTDKVFSLNDVANASLFWNCISDDVEATFSNFERMLLKKINGDFNSESFSYVNASIHEMIKYKGNVAVDTLINRTGISVKHLNNLFEKYVGVNPKMINRIFQLNHFISYKTNNPYKTFTDCCYEAGYYDQAHLIKSFRLFTNKSPKNYFRKSSYINEHFSVF